jgi:hypothetical protein
MFSFQQKFLELHGATDALRNFLRVNRVTAVVVMGWEVGDVTNIRRDLTVFSDGIHKAKQVRKEIRFMIKLAEDVPITLFSWQGRMIKD